MVEIRKMEGDFSQLRELWCKVFGDKPGYVDEMFRAFGYGEINPQIEGYVIADSSTMPAKVLAATTQFKMGELIIPGETSKLGETSPSRNNSPQSGGETSPSRNNSPQSGGETSPSRNNSPQSGGETSPSRNNSPQSGETSPSRNNSPQPGGETSPSRNNLPQSGEAHGIPIYISYAICTDNDFRGKGYGSMITEFAKDAIEKRGALSMLAPANQKLIRFYQPLGYEPRFYASEKEIEIDYSIPHEIGDTDLPLKLEKIDAEEYGKLREKLLAGIPHIKLSNRFLKYVESQSKAFVKVDGGRIIACVDSVGRTRAIFSEILGDESTRLLDIEAAVNLISQLHGMKTAEYRTIGGDYLQTGRYGGDYVQGMISSDSRIDFSNGYMGFPLD